MNYELTYRPADASADILPVLSAADLLTGIRAETQLIRDRLNLLTGDWWENPEWGNGVLELLRESRLTETDRQILANYLSDYIRKTPGVVDVREVKCSFEGGQFRYECTVETGAGTARISYG